MASSTSIVFVLNRSAAILVFCCVTTLIQASERDLREGLEPGIQVGPVSTGRLHAVCEAHDFVWVGGDNGLFRIKSGAQFPQVQGNPQFLKGTTVNCFWPAKDRLWIGSEGGLFYWKPGLTNPESAEGELGVPKPLKVRALCFLNDTLWIGTDICLNRWIPATRHFEKMKGGTVFYLDGTRKALWAATDRGLFRWEGNQSGFQRQWSLIATSVHQMGSTLWLTDNQNNLWRGEATGPEPKDPTTLQTGRIYRFLEQKGTLWMGAERGLFSLEQGEKEPWSPSLPTGRINDLFQGPKGLWIATENNGLFRKAGPNSQAWEAKIRVIGHSSWLPSPDAEFSINWEIDGYDWRATPETVRTRVVVYDSKAQPTKLSEWEPGRTEARFHGLKRAGDYYMVVEAKDLNGEVVVSSDQNIAAKGWWWWAGWVILFCGLVAMSLGLAFYPPLGRLAQAIILGYRWNISFVSPTTYYDVGRLAEAKETYTIRRSSGQAVVQTTEANVQGGWPWDSTWPQDQQHHIQGDHNVHVLVDEPGYRYPWSHLISYPWSKGENCVIAGQLIANVLQPPLQKLRWRIWFAGLGSIDGPPNMPLSKLLNCDLEVKEVTETFMRARAKILQISPRAHVNAKVEDFRLALEQADIIHLAAHATADEILLADDAFSVANLSRLRVIRCRLLVLSACNLGDFRASTHPLAYELVLRGINVVASLVPANDFFCQFFFPNLYRMILPSSKRVGEPLGRAVQRTADLWKQFLQAPQNQEKEARYRSVDLNPVNQFVLYGNPSFQLRYM
jgi:hypothetical protein